MRTTFDRYAHRVVLLIGMWLGMGIGVEFTKAGTFSNAWLTVNDPTGGLTLNTTNNTYTVSFWFRLAIPSSVSLSDNLTLLMDRSDGNEGANYAYLFRYNASNGTVEFLTRGSTTFTKVLIAQPYMERWYHVAVVRQGAAFSSYVDGKPVLPLNETPNVGNLAGAGLTMGGSSASASRAFYGDIIEVAIYQAALDLSLLQDRMFKDQRNSENIRGYYKLGYSTNAEDFVKNFAPLPPSGTASAQKQGGGVIDYEETDQAGEQSTFDSRKNAGDEAIVPLSGTFAWSQKVLSRPTPGVSFEFIYGYSSGMPVSAPTDGSNDPYDRRSLGPGWRHMFDVRLVVQDNPAEWRVLAWNGGIETWIKTNGVFKTRHNEYRGELVQLAGGDYEWTTRERVIWRFRDPAAGPLMGGRLMEIRDFSSNKVQMVWNEAEGYLRQVYDTGGGRYDFGFDTVKGRLTNVVFQGWSVNFEYDPNNFRLISKSVTAPAGYTNFNTRWQFYYNAVGVLERIMDPRGYTNVFIQYDRYGRRTNEVDGLGRVNSYTYGVTGRRQINRTDPEGFKWVETYDRKHRLAANRDPLGNAVGFTYDAAGNQTSITDGLGYKTFFGYDGRANVIGLTNALGEVRQWVYHGFFNKAIQEITPQPGDVNGRPAWTNYYELDGVTGNLLRHYDELGTLVRYTYTTNGLADSKTDGNGNVTRAQYDTNGFVLASTDAAGHTTRFGRNEWGWPLAETNALGEVTAYGYDVNGKAVRRVDALSRVFARRYDENGNLVEDYDAKGQATRYAYDAENQRTQMVDRASAVWATAYTVRGQPLTATDPLGNTATNFYDAANRKVRVAYPLGLSGQMQYDGNGRVTNSVDRLGQSWQKVYDRLGREIALMDPLGDVKKTAYDIAGRIKEIRTPNGYPSVHFYDGRGRLKKWVDAEGYEWGYNYDGVGSITNVTDALGGHYTMAYGSRNERVLERNQDNFEWTYEYDELLRPKFQRDPNGTAKTYRYDAGGRLESAVFSTGRVNSFLYDDNNNPEVISRSGSGAATIARLTYDELDRVREYRDPFGKLLRYGFDAAGRLTSTVYPDGKVLTNRFDALGRMTNNVFQFNSQSNYSMAFGYDGMDRLLWRVYPNGVGQTNNFDVAGRITGIAYGLGVPLSSNQVSIALTYAYDRNGNKTGSAEKGTLDWKTLLESEERAEYSKSGRLIDRQIQGLGTNVAARQTLNYQHDASGNMTNAAGGGQTFVLAYDEDNRVTALSWDCGLTAVSIANRYDVFGRRVAKVADGVENRYVLDLAGKMERVLCDLTPFGRITAWYVHAPDLVYRVMPDGSVLCYHSDGTGNIVATSDGQKGIGSQYAYTPYGRSLGETNWNASRVAGIAGNPYRFVGAQGVMEEVPNLFFMRARYYSAEATVFLSTDPIKRVGPGWKPMLYAYSSNPLRNTDPNGEDFWEYDVGDGGFSVHKGNWGGPGYSGGRYTTFRTMDEIRSAEQDLASQSPNHLPYADSEDKHYMIHDERFVSASTQQDPLRRYGTMAAADQMLGASLWGDAASNLVKGQFGDALRCGLHATIFNSGIATSINVGSDVVGKTISAVSNVGRKVGEIASQTVQNAGSMVNQTIGAINYASAKNVVQSVLPKLATTAISVGSSIVGDMAGNAVANILPKNTPPIIKEVVKTGVSYAVSIVVVAILGIHKGFVFVMFFQMALLFHCFRLFRRHTKMHRVRPIFIHH